MLSSSGPRVFKMFKNQFEYITSYQGKGNVDYMIPILFTFLPDESFFALIRNVTQRFSLIRDTRN